MNDTTFLYLLVGLFTLVVLLTYIFLHLANYGEITQMATLMLSGLLQLYAGMFLFSHSQKPCFANIKGVLALIPTMMDLKGNLEISLASRISTLANTTDTMHTFQGTWGLIKQNVVLIQCQVTFVALISVAITTGYLSLTGSVSWSNVATLTSIALTTGFITCTLLGKYHLLTIFRVQLDNLLQEASLHC